MCFCSHRTPGRVAQDIRADTAAGRNRAGREARKMRHANVNLKSGPGRGAGAAVGPETARTIPTRTRLMMQVAFENARFNLSDPWKSHAQSMANGGLTQSLHPNVVRGAITVTACSGASRAL